MEVAALGLRVDGVGNIDQATDSLGRFTQSAGSAEKSAGALAPASTKGSKAVQDLGKSSSSTAGSLSNLATGALKVGGVIAAAFSVTKIIQYADAWSDMQSRIGAVTGDMDGAGASMQRILQIANASYSPLAQTAEVYSRNVATFRDLGKSAAEAADFTEAVNNALVVTATRGEDAAVVVNSLSRSLAIGKLDADAFDTIVSRSPRTLKAVADEMGVTTIELRKLASEGKVTSDVISRGLVGSLDQLKSEAAEMPATMTDAFVRVGNNVTAFVGIMDQATGASGMLANKIIELSDSALEMATSEEVIAGLLSWMGTIQAIGRDFAELDRIISGFTSNAEENADDIGFSFSEIPANIRAAIQIATVEIASWIDSQLLGIQALSAAAKAITSGPSAAANAFNAVLAQNEGLKQARLDSLNAILEERDAILTGAKDAAKAYKDKTRQALDFNAAVVGGVPAIKAVDKEAEKAAKKQEDAAAKFIENLKQQLFQTEKRTAIEKMVFDIQKEGLKLSDEQLQQATSLASAIDAVAIAERNRAAEVDRQNTAYQLQESLIAKQQQYSGELSTAGMGGRAASQMTERLAMEQAAQRELRDIQHQHGQEMREAETEDQRKHLQTMFQERLALTMESQALELEAYDNFTQQKNALDADWMAGASAAFATYSEQANDLYGQTAEMVTSTLDSVTSGISESITQAVLYGEDFKESMAAVGQSILDNVLNALVKMGVQYGINAALSKAFGSSATAAGVAQAASLSAAWATAAAMVSLASFGANGAAASAAIASTTALSQGLASVGFQQGGYTGNMGVSDIAGVVHGKEFVFDAAATSRIGVPTLEAISAGRPIGSSGVMNGSGGGAGQPITIAPQITVNGDPDKSTLARIERATAEGARIAYQKISNDLATGRGTVSKSLQSGYSVGRRTS